MTKHLIFVYGTLKNGWGNNVIIADQKFIGKATTVANEYQMYSLGGFPGVVDGNNSIKGELWEVDDGAFARCDRLEGQPTFYKREVADVAANDGTYQKAWMYLYQGDVSNCKPIDEWVR